MLASLLPGIRDLRVPLAAGVVWLTSVWVATGWLVPAVDDFSLLGRQIVSLASAAGGSVAVVVIGFVAYLVGIVLSPLRLPKRLFPRSEKVLGRYVETRFREFALLEIRKAEARGVTPALVAENFPELANFGYDDGDTHTKYRHIEWEEDESRDGGVPLSQYIEARDWEYIRKSLPDRFLARLTEDRSTIDTALQDGSKELYSKYDRDKAEAEFRHGVALPLVVLSVSLAIRAGLEFAGAFGLIFLVGLAIAYYLEVSGRQKDQEANDLLIQTILLGKVQSPAMRSLTELAP